MSKLLVTKISLLACLFAMGCAQTDMGVANSGSDTENEDQPATSADAGPPPADAAPVVTSMFVHTADALYVVDDVNFDLTEVGVFNADNSMMDMAVTPDGEIYTISYSAVYRIDQQSGNATQIVEVPSGNVGMTFLPDGTLLAADNAGDVRVIDPTNGDITEIGSFGNGYALAGDLVAIANGTMYGIADEGPVGTEATSNVLLRVDTGTGQATAIGPIGYAGVFGVAVANDHVYAFTRGGEIVEIDPVSGVGTLVREYPEISFWGAGVTPQAVID